MSWLSIFFNISLLLGIVLVVILYDSHPKRKYIYVDHLLVLIIIVPSIILSMTLMCITMLFHDNIGMNIGGILILAPIIIYGINFMNNFLRNQNVMKNTDYYS